MNLQTTFCESLAFIALGQVYRQTVLKRPGHQRDLTILVTMCLQITLPCTLIRFVVLFPPSLEALLVTKTR